jgi:hypothetical protein
MVDILNLRPSPDGPTSSPIPKGSRNNEEAQVTSPPSSLKESIVQGLKGTVAQVPGQAQDDKAWQYTKTIPTVVLYDHKGGLPVPGCSNADRHAAFTGASPASPRAVGVYAEVTAPY